MTSTILAIETAADYCSVALFYQDKTIAESLNEPRMHQQHLLPMIETVLAKAELTQSQIDYVALSQGPGSFTGLRIGAAVAQGLAYAIDCEVVMISTLAIMAEAAFQTLNQSHILCALDARMNEMYWGGYQRDAASAVLTQVVPDAVEKPEQLVLPAELEDTTWHAVGPGWHVYRERLSQTLQDTLVFALAELAPSAQHMQNLALDAIKTRQVVSPDKAIPVYLRDDVAQKKP